MRWTTGLRGKVGGFARRGQVWILSALLGCLSYGLSLGGEEGSASLKPTDLLPKDQDLKGWQSEGPPSVYTGEELFDYINGGAELYLEFNFKQVGVQEYRNDAGSSLVVEVYEMDSPKNAYGLYSFDTRGEHPAIGQEATYSFGLLKFWKDRFLCRILSLDAEEAMKGVIFSLGEKIAAKIPSEGTKSPILAYVPKENVVPESIHYFHQRVTLNNFYFLSDENILNLNQETEGVFFEHQLAGKTAKVILIRYPGTPDSLAAFEKALHAYFQERKLEDSGPTEKKQIIKSIKQGEYAGMKWAQNYLVLTFGAQDQRSCQDLLESMAKRVGQSLE